MKENKMVQSNNEFVRREQAKLRGMMGGRPGCPPAMKELDAYMSNDGEGAQDFARKLTKGMDDAFPVK